MSRVAWPPAADLLRLMRLCGLTGDTWAAWRVILRGALGDLLAGEDLSTWRDLTGRETSPTDTAREVWLIAGRRGGKSILSALLGVFVAVMGRFSLAPGEVPVVMLLASDRRQARILRRYAAGLLRSTPALASMIVSETADSLTLSNGVVIEVHTASVASVRGYSLAACICDEVAFWGSDDEATDSDVEILNAIRPALATLRGPLIVLSSPYARRGVLWDAYERHYGRDSDVVVVAAPTLRLNPTLDPAIVAEAMATDEPRARAEWGGEFRGDVESFVSAAVIAAAVEPGVVERGWVSGLHYVAAADPAGGSGKDSYTATVGHVETDEAGVRRAVQDALVEVRPPFSPEAATAEIAAMLARYRVRHVVGDRYAGDWPAEALRRHGVTYTPSSWTATEAYAEALPALNSRRVALVDNPRLVAQLCALERRATRTGKVLISHPPNRHDDAANASALLVTQLMSTTTNAVMGLVW